MMNNIFNFIMGKIVFLVVFGLGMLWYIFKKGKIMFYKQIIWYGYMDDELYQLIIDIV